jgi:hypothetical protein
MADRKGAPHLFIVNKNHTMVPTLRYGDVARLEPCEVSQINLGDVICFYRSLDHGWISRVVRREPHGLRTRGDNTPRNDPWLINSEDLIGRVVGAHRGSRVIKIRHGKIGRSLALGFRVLHLLESWFSPALRDIYQRLADQGLCRRWLPARWTPRLVAFQHPQGPAYQLLLGWRLVGQRLPGKPWQIQRPFRIFVAEKSLPG